jgi:hypothetical protein
MLAGDAKPKLAVTDGSANLYTDPTNNRSRKYPTLCYRQILHNPPVEMSGSRTSYIQVKVKLSFEKEKGDAICIVDLRIAGGFRGTKER